MRGSGVRRPLTTLAAGSCVLLALSGCSVPGFGPDADEAVEQLASALERGDLRGVRLAGDDAAATKELEHVLNGLAGGADPDVEVARVSTDGDAATGQLGWRWKVGPETWSYDTDVKLTRAGTDDGDQWLVRWSPTMVEPSLKDGEQLDLTTIKAERGEILGAGDEPIVTLRPVLRVGVDKTGLAAAAARRSATQVARLVDVDARPLVKQVEAAGPRAFVQAIVYRRAEAPEAVLAGLSGIDGARAISDRLPLAPSKDFAGPVLGTVGPATAEVIEDSEGRVKAGDDVGLSGLQKRYDEQLAGTRGAKVVAVDADGERRDLFVADPEPGKPLRTTLDLATQRTAQRVLSGVGPASALVAVRPSTGELLAVASGPGSNGYNTATFGQYAPGSTFKVVTTLALLRAGLTPRSSVECPPTTVVDGKRFKNYDDYPGSGIGRISFEDALANSCNTAFIEQRDQLGQGDLAEAAAALGLGVDHDTGFPAYFGEVGKPGSETQAAASMIGQGAVLASPMAMALVVASVLEGKAVLPRLLPDHEVERQEPKAPLTGSEAEQLRSMMRAVVERGSGSLLSDVPGQPVVAKTGTAEFGDQPPLPTHAWMVAGRDDLAVAAFVERGDSGSGTAGPVLRRFLEAVPSGAAQ
jgi:cell division protein FtsI/penicillin-binding protein 2